MGIGTGHTPTEWTSVGRAFPIPGQRVDRIIGLVAQTAEKVGRLVSLRND